MKTIDLLEETFSAITVNKVRSSLTILGIIIGIGSVIAMISIGQGAQGSIQTRIESAGSNLIQIMPGFQRGIGQQVNTGRGNAQSLTLKDSGAIAEKVSGIKAVAPQTTSRYQITAKGNNTNTQVIGTVSEYAGIRNVEMEQGAFLGPQNQRSTAKVAVLGPTTRDDLFGEGVNALGQSLRINKIEFKVIGITKAKGGTGFGNQDDLVYIPLSTSQRFLSGNEYISSISIQTVTQEVMTDVQTMVTNLLLENHNISDGAQADFSVLNQADLVSAASSVTQTFTILLAAIAGISLLVGGIGIMNMMLTTVTERTREIGLRKAVGAKNKDISRQFLAESVTLTFIGGLLGMGLGWLLAFIASSFLNTPTKISLTSVLLAVSVSASIGLVFGYYPARRAAKLNPIEALRYE